MQERTRVHYHHADGVALGGTIEHPFQESIPVQASLSLPPTGGHISLQVGRFEYRDIVSYSSAHVHVAGKAMHRDGPWTTLVTTTVEDLNLLEVVKAKRVVARISTEHPAEGYHPTVSFIGTEFEGLRIGGCDVSVDLDVNFCKTGKDGRHPERSCTDDDAFLERVNQQRKVFIDEKKRLEKARNKVSDFVTRHASDYSDGKHRKSGHLLCSLVRKITVDESQKQFAGKGLGHILHVPDFGKVYLGELIVSHGHFQLIMLRFELGCPVVGTTGVVVARVNGSTDP